MRVSRIVLIAALVAGALPLVNPFAPHAGADVLIVTRKNDPPPSGCHPTDCSLREAVIASNNRPGPDVIKLGRGRYELTRPMPDEEASLSGDLDIAKNVTIDGKGRNKTVIDGNRNDRIFHIFSNVDDARFRDLAIKRGSRIVDEAQEQGGGGILNLGTLKLARVLVENNRVRVDGFGGGISNLGRLVISNSRITRNEANGTSRGAGIDNSPGDVVARVILRDSRVDHNVAAGNDGGGLYNNSAVALLFDSRVDHNRVRMGCCGGGVNNDAGRFEATRSSFNSNTSGGCCGGGIFTSGGASDVLLRKSVVKDNLVKGCCGGGLMTQGSPMVLRDTLISSNKVEGCCGGGVMLQLGGTTEVINSRVLANKVLGCCGGGLINQGGSLIVTDTLVRNNKVPAVAGSGGGISIQTSGLALVLEKSTIAGNSVGGNGGGISFSSGNAEVSTSTISGNTAGGSGGGIDETTSGQIELTYVTVTKNESAGSGGGIATNGGTWTILKSIVGNNSDDCNAILTGPTGKNLDKDSSCFGNAAAIHAGPRLRDLANYGGKTPTHKPRQSSPAVDVVPVSVCPPPDIDQRGVSRPKNGDGVPGSKCDLGAHERKP